MRERSFASRSLQESVVSAASLYYQSSNITSISLVQRVEALDEACPEDDGPEPNWQQYCSKQMSK